MAYKATPQPVNQGSISMGISPVQQPQFDPFGILAKEKQRQDMYNSYPEYKKGYDPETMSMTKYLKEIQPQFDQGYNKFKDEATRDGGSGWLRRTEFMNALNEKDARDRGAAEVGGRTGEALSKLAAQGGMSSGARERAVMQGSKNWMDMSQDASREADRNNLSAGIQDEGNRINMLGQLPGMEQQRMSNWTQARAGDLNNQLTESDRYNKFRMDRYNTRMQTWAAEQQATATENSGGGCFMTTAMCEYFGLPDDCRELTLMRKLRDEYGLTDEERKKDVEKYYEMAKTYDPILREKNVHSIYEAIKLYVSTCADLVERDEYEKAYQMYKRLVVYVERELALSVELDASVQSQETTNEE